MKHKLIYISIGLLSVILMLMCMPFSVHAVGTGTIEILISDCNVPMSDTETEVKVYQFAAFSDVGTLCLTNDFAECGVTVDELKAANAAEMNQIAKTLTAYTEDKSIKGESYPARLSKDVTVSGLENGVYLITIDDAINGRFICRFSPMLCMIPSVNADGSDMYTIEATPKFSLDNSTYTETETSTTSTTGSSGVLASSTTTRPRFTETSTHTTTTNSPDLGTSTTTSTITITTSTTTFTSVTTVLTTVKTTATTVSNERLPQTGTLVWIVYLLAGVGIVCLITSWGSFRKGGSGKSMKITSFIIGFGCLTGAGSMYAKPYFAERASAPVMSMAVSEIRKAQRNYEETEIINSEPDISADADIEDVSIVSQETEYAELETIADEPVQVVQQTYEVDGNAYIGILEIPAISLELPIADNCSMATLNYSPGCYSGAAVTSDLVLGAHNYTSHFGKIYLLSSGAEVIFTDIKGNTYCYQVTEVTEVSPDRTYDVCNSGHDLALFTCNSSGARRVVVYCDLIKE